MKFRTEISLAEERSQIDYDSQLLLIGSCFSEHVFDRLSYHKFKVKKNPFGILYNPKAIETFFTNVLNQKNYTEKDIFLQNERWHCFDTHSDLSSNTSEELLNNLNKAVNETYELLLKSSHVFITLGSAWIYRHIATDNIVGNCHKVPNNKFLKELMQVDEVSDSLLAINTLLKAFNPSLTIVYSLSPIRHLRDGFVGNAQSKAHVLAGIHDQIDAYKDTHYFPSYEIMMDDLRDYRFYADDLLHPNNTAINYIWECFKNVWFDKSTFPIMKKVDAIQKKIAHRPFNPDSLQHNEFLVQLNKEIVELERVYNIKIP